MPGRAGRNRTRDPHYYWNNTARTKPEAQALATTLGLDFPANQFDGVKSGLVYPIRRLIITGEDSPTNFASLLGPLWEIKAIETIKGARIEVLSRPPPGSPGHAVSEHLDAGSPRWTPRGPSPEEAAELEKVRDVKQRVTGQLGGRLDVKTKDIKDILMGMEGNWVDNLKTLETAVNGTDQGVGR